jgi:hypothetical protein
MSNIKVWAQMFFDDGSVSISIRLDADIYDDNEHITKVAQDLLQTVNRTEGLLVLWGAGQLVHRYYVTSSFSSSQESDS